MLSDEMPVSYAGGRYLSKSKRVLSRQKQMGAV